MVKDAPANQGDAGLIPGVRKIPWRRKRLPTPIVLPGKSHGQKRLEGYSPWGHKESDTTKQLNNNETPELGLPLLQTALAKISVTQVCLAALHFSFSSTLSLHHDLQRDLQP